MDHDSADRHVPLVDLARAHALVEGANLLPLPGVAIYRADRTSPCTSTLYDPCLAIVLQGSKRGYLKGRPFRYDPSTYLAYSAPVPIDVEVTEASPERPFLALVLSLNAGEIAEMQLEIDADETEAVADRHSGRGAEALPEVVTTSPLEPAIRDAAGRLLASLRDPAEARVLGDLARREILFRALRGEQGGNLRAMLEHKGHAKRIADVIRDINEDYARPLTTAQMMHRAGMSKTVLHESFKAVTGLTPLQYVKSIRLHRARVMMLEEGVSASTAAHRVGYASPSQFNREFKRLFGRPPGQSARAAR